MDITLALSLVAFFGLVMSWLVLPSGAKVAAGAPAAAPNASPVRA